MRSDTIRVLLKEWVVADGECSVPSVGDVITIGLGLDVDGVGVEGLAGRTDGIESTAQPVLSRRSADVILTGRLRVVPDADGSPFAQVLTPVTGIHVVLLGAPAVFDAESRVCVRGILVVEPHMWGRRV